MADIELGPKMQACSDRERRFVLFLLAQDDLNASEAARQAGYADPGPHSAAVRVKGHQLMHRDRVLEAIEEVGRKEFRSLLVNAILATKRLIANKDHPDHAKVVQSTLSRLGLGERSGVDVKVSGEVQHNHTDAALADLRVLLQMGVPREKLVETFGFSGLARYEKMLAVADGRAAKVIEHEPQQVSRETISEVKDA